MAPTRRDAPDDAPTPMQVPSDLAMDSARAGHVLAAIGVDLPAGSVTRGAALMRDASLVRWGSPTWWSVGAVAVRAPYGRIVVPPLGTAATVPQCRECHSVTCEHVAAVLLAFAATVDPRSPLLRDPEWALVTAPLVTSSDAPPSAKAPPRGWVRYHLAEGGDGALGGIARTVRRELIRLAKGGHELPPAKMPTDIDAARVDGITDVDRAVHRLLTEAHLLLFGSSAARRDARLRALGSERLGAALRALADGADVRMDGEPVRVSATPIRPELVVEEGPDGALHLRLAPLRARVVDLGEPWVLADGVIAPLDPDAPPEVAAMLGVALPPVPLADVPRFLERVVVRSRLPVRLDAAAGAVAEAAPELRIQLSETHDALEVSTQIAYVPTAGEAVPLSPGAGMTLALRRPDGSVAVTQRDLDREQELLDQAVSLAGRRLPAVLREDEAADFLADRLPALREVFPIWGDRALATRVRGKVTPTVSVESGADWFDLGVRFDADGARVQRAEVLRSWMAGRRWVRLPGGGLARLPLEWLERHGRALTELEDLQERSRLGAWTATLVEQLLGEADGHSRAAAERWRELAHRIRTFEGVERRPVPATMLATLRDYQVQGFQWLAFLRDVGLGGVLADDMGLGKTLQTLALLADTHATPGPPSLVVAPTSVVHAWAEEARRFVPSLRVTVHHGPERGPLDGDVVVTTYALMRRDLQELQAVRWRTLVLDEAQVAKNPSSEASRAARSLDAGQRIALTGTPMENNLFELYGIFQLLMPGFFGSQIAFARRYATPIHTSQESKALAALRARIRPFVLRRLKEEVAAELPPLTEVVLRCALGPAQRRLYERVRDTYRASVLDKDANSLHVLEALTRLRQACCDPRLLPFDEARACTESAKLDLLMDTLDETRAAGHRTLVFSQWTSLLALAQERLTARGVPFQTLDGSTTNRQALVERWNRPDGPPVFLISLKAGGTGLTLTGADHVIHLDPWWNPAAQDQATDRAHRIGQTRPVVAATLVAEDTVEETILEIQRRKRALFEATLDTDRLLVEGLTRADLEAVFAGGSQAEGAPIEDDLPPPIAPQIPWTAEDEGR